MSIKIILTCLLFSMISSLPAVAATAFLDREYITGQTKTCIYKFLGNEYAITIKAYQMCPYSIKV